MKNTKMINGELSDVFEAGGRASIVGAILMNVWNWVSIDDINAVIVLLTSIGGLFFIFFKLQHTYFLAKNEKIEYRRNKKEEDSEEL